MVLSKLDVAIVAVLAFGMLWIEHEHRIMIGMPAAAEAAPPAASVCPDTDDVPYSPACIAFIAGGVLPDTRARVTAAPPAVTSDSSARTELAAPACPPSNENAPYSARCLKFLSGWFWQAYPPANAR